MRVIFMGTPDFSVGTLQALIDAGHEVVLAVTQPDKPKGRGKSMQFPPVKEAALEHGIEVYQPRRVREPECVEYLRSFDADIIVVVAFGQILPKEILEMPKYGCVNVHASLLPKYRGAAPIQWAVINGEKVSGVTTMRMDEGLDTGDMILKEEVVLDEKETGGSLEENTGGNTGGNISWGDGNIDWDWGFDPKPDNSNTDKTEDTQTKPQQTIKVGKPKISLKRSKTKIQVQFKKVKNAKKYQIQYATNKKFKKAKSKTTTKLKYTIKGLKKNKKYYVRVRGVNGTTKGRWSAVKKK